MKGPYERRGKENHDIPKYYWLIAIVATLSALMWTYLMSEMLVDLLGTYLDIMKLDKTFMGMTVLGIGNALDDALVTIALANSGNVAMAISSGYGG